MDRIELIQNIFQKTDFENYLEIGCRKGKSFLPIRAKNKVAVDPVFKIAISRRLKWLMKWPANFQADYFQLESDVFFETQKDYLQNLGPLDVVLIDGLHNFRASLHDVLHSLTYLNDEGLIILHDCYPPHEAAAVYADVFPTEEQQQQLKGWTGEWCGDVWKTISYLMGKYPDLLDVGVINTDYGLGYVRFKTTPLSRKFEVDEDLFVKVDQLTYKELKSDPEKIINLEPASFSDTVLSWY
ncbi:hypothetical protein A33Q_1856 [Indibacter alkaliphilus LW1]|uniref:Methyltransferase domain-containing protein n=1 Tax=Indibacter alkaliphilus (strain CCUG 57479 / KCTC 22604 / LW1) TaxID=1189612 RepID=S2E3Z6_INDAL|nr:class I SAM-dependent methyltransferase [Indibacter alkaliphilus]EOZ96938.1 hypothetical protein A33Q_1856 [Indibacter alkaliphilus LW1]